ncbi:sarcosine dehydrogenase [[Emmonsia] crescens]|uniref:Sarcosine dehydrogenase n=1 Tax=[Emmonsia] crescens TaxID=73230 RepID=A0A2B7ZS18_9EURO|nr:sarcosine dehydrogenase [Emmonsia crescens]
MSTTPFSTIQKNPAENSIFIVGGGIVGTSLAYYLSKSTAPENGNPKIVVLDKSLSSMLGSTNYAPGFVGQYNDSTIETKLAVDSVREYRTVPNGFDVVGGMELAATNPGVERLKQRCSSALAAGLPSEMIAVEKAAALAPDFVKTDNIKAALHFASDGTANPGVITSYFRQKAVENGAYFVQAGVMEFETGDDGMIKTISTSEGPLNVDSSSSIVLATGIWTRFLLNDASSGTGKPITKSPIPIIPVAHPYTFTPTRAAREGPPYPFVRWPEQSVYARDHGTNDGMGTYNHEPIQITDPFNSALGSWPTIFETALAEGAKTCLRNGEQFLTRDGCTDEVIATAKRRPFNGIFSVSPDNLPLAGKVEDVQNLWLCAAVWVSHAAGVAGILAREMLREEGDDVSPDDEVVLKALDPNRFLGRDMDQLTRMALRRYNDIYNSQPL